MSKAASSLGVAAVLAVLLGTGGVRKTAAKDRAKGGLETFTITLRVYDYVHVSRPQLLAAEGVATAILSEAGLEAHWVDCPTSKAEWDNYPDCKSAWVASDFVLRFMPKTMADLMPKGADALGSTPECYVDAICTTSIFYHRVISIFESGGKASVPVLLGRAMAHEIGHMLLGENSHATKGIMRAAWSDQDLTLEARPYLRFTQEQSNQIKSRLAARAQAWQVQANVAGLGPR
jgi:hypothetical protein